METGVVSSKGGVAVTQPLTDAKAPSDKFDKRGKKHPLHRPWTLWYDSISTYDSNKWELSLVEVMTVRTVEDFFTMLHFIKPPHILRVSAQYHFFREGVKPMWEDPNNKSGGKIWVSLDEKSITESTGKRGEHTNGTNPNESAQNHPTDAPAKKEEVENEKPELDAIWQNILMSMIGEYLDNGVSGDHIMGVVFSKRKYHNRIALWLRDATNTDAIAAIEKNLVKEAGLPSSVKLIFTPHGNGK